MKKQPRHSWQIASLFLVPIPALPCPGWWWWASRKSLKQKTTVMKVHSVHRINGNLARWDDWKKNIYIFFLSRYLHDYAKQWLSWQNKISSCLHTRHVKLKERSETCCGADSELGRINPDVFSVDLVWTYMTANMTSFVTVAAVRFYITLQFLCFHPFTQDRILLGLAWLPFIEPGPILAAR